nr:YafY family protein [Natronospira proteinivora]
MQNHRGLSAAAIARHWEISERSVYRDLAALGEAGVPIHFCEERQGYVLMADYHLPPIQFTDQEAAALSVGGVVARNMADESLKAPLRSALTKMRSVLPAASLDYLKGLEASVGVWKTAAAAPGHAHRFMPVQDAVLRRRCIDLCYDTGGQGRLRRRTVEPLGLLFYAEHWHLIAYCRWRRDFRDFRLDRVRELEVLEGGFDGHVDFNIDDFLASVIADCELTPVTLTLPRTAVDRFQRELFGTPTQQTDLPDGRCRLSILAHAEDWLVDWLLSFGPELRVEAPQSLRRKLGESARQIAEQHLGKPLT